MLNLHARMVLTTMGIGAGVSVLLAAAGAPVLVVLPATLLVMGPAALMYGYLSKAHRTPHGRIRLASLSAGGVASLLSGCYGWHPLACVGVAGVTALTTAAVLDDRDRRRARERHR